MYNFLAKIKNKREREREREGGIYFYHEINTLKSLLYVSPKKKIYIYIYIYII